MLIDRLRQKHFANENEITTEYRTIEQFLILNIINT